MTRKKKSKRQKLRDLADNKLQEWARATYKNCLLCPRPVSCGHHFIAKANSLALRYYKPNLIPICFYHHALIGCQPAEPNARIGQIMGKEWLLDIKQARKKVVRDNLKYYEDAIKKFKQI